MSYTPYGLTPLWNRLTGVVVPTPLSLALHFAGVGWFPHGYTLPLTPLAAFSHC